MPPLLFPRDGARLPRVVVVQDRPLSVRYQTELLRRMADEQGIALAIASLDLRDEVDDNVARLAEVEGGIDWLVTDLLIDSRDQMPENSQGIHLLRELVGRHMFGGYSHQPRPGVRSIAISSACVDHGTVFLPELRRVLEQLGVQFRFLGRGGDFEPLARVILGEIAASAAAGG